MSLLQFHRFLIATGILFCAGYAVRELVRARGGGGPAALALGVLFAVLAVGLLVYLVRLRRFLGYDKGAPSPR